MSALANSCTHIYPPTIYVEGGLSPDVTPWDVASAVEDSMGRRGQTRQRGGQNKSGQKSKI